MKLFRNKKYVRATVTCSLQGQRGGLLVDLELVRLVGLHHDPLLLGQCCPLGSQCRSLQKLRMKCGLFSKIAILTQLLSASEKKVCQMKADSILLLMG